MSNEKARELSRFDEAWGDDGFRRRCPSRGIDPFVRTLIDLLIHYILYYRYTSIYYVSIYVNLLPPCYAMLCVYYTWHAE